MLTASPILRKEKNPIFPFSKEKRPFWEYLLLNVIKHPHAKFTPLGFMNKKVIRKRGKANVPLGKPLTEQLI